MSLKLGFDMDEIIARTCDYILEMVNKKYGLSTNLATIDNTCLETCKYVDDPKLNLQIVRDVVKWVNDTDIQLEMDIYKEAQRHLRHFKKAGHKLYFVSARPKENEVNTVKWLRKHGFPFDGVYVIGKSPKGEVGRKLKLDLFIDDVPRHLASMLEYKKQWKGGLFLMDRPWNRDEELDKKIKRVFEWPEVERSLGTTKREYNH